MTSSLSDTFDDAVPDAVVSFLRDAGLVIDELREHASAPWKALSFLVESEPGVWTNPPDRPALPLTFSIRASRPSPSK